MNDDETDLFEEDEFFPTRKDVGSPSVALTDHLSPDMSDMIPIECLNEELVLLCHHWLFQSRRCAIDSWFDSRYGIVNNSRISHSRKTFLRLDVIEKYLTSEEIADVEKAVEEECKAKWGRDWDAFVRRDLEYLENGGITQDDRAAYLGKMDEDMIEALDIHND
jgi:hypothetical protein